MAYVLEDHVTLEVKRFDRMYLKVYVPQLQWDRGVVEFLRFHSGHQFPSSAMMSPITRTFAASIEQFVTSNTHATIFHMLGLDSRRLDIPDRKPLEIDYGQPIHEIIG